MEWPADGTRLRWSGGREDRLHPLPGFAHRRGPRPSSTSLRRAGRWLGIPWPNGGMGFTRDSGLARARWAPVARLAGTALGDVVSLGAPGTCAGCQRPGSAVCAPCEAHLLGPARPHAPSPTPPGWMPTYVASDYEGITRAIITAWKERGRRDVAVHLAHALSVAMRAVISDDEARAERNAPHLTVVPIPSSPAARRRRGEDAWDRVVRLAISEVSRDCRIDVARCLHLTRQPRDQAGLSAQERRANLTGALACRTAPRTPIVLVDDIVTTGATLAEGARALRAAGGEVRWAAAMAATSRSIG